MQLLLTNVFGQADYYMRLARHVKHMDKLTPPQYAVVQAKGLTVGDCVALARYHHRMRNSR